jgi:hypothetical protein
MSITTTPVREKALLKNDSIFSGNKIVMMSDQTGPTITGNITIRAFVCIATKDDVKDDFHYIVCQNIGDNKNPEIFLRLRGDGTNANF